MIALTSHGAGADLGCASCELGAPSVQRALSLILSAAVRLRLAVIQGQGSCSVVPLNPDDFPCTIGMTLQEGNDIDEAALLIEEEVAARAGGLPAGAPFKRELRAFQQRFGGGEDGRVPTSSFSTVQQLANYLSALLVLRSRLPSVRRRSALVVAAGAALGALGLGMATLS